MFDQLVRALKYMYGGETVFAWYHYLSEWIFKVRMGINILNEMFAVSSHTGYRGQGCFL